MPNITCPHCQHEFYMANHLEETRHLEFDQLRRSVDDLAKRNKLGSAKTDELEDRIHELEHSERLSNRLVNLESEVDALRSLVNDEIDGLRSRLYGLESEVASGRAFPRANEEELEELRGRGEFDQQKQYKPRSKEIEDKFNQGQQGWFEDQLETALQEIEWLKERVEDIERAAAEQKSHINALHLSREQGQVAEAQALSPEQIEKVLRDTAEKKTIDVAAELRERIEKLENALHSRLLELEKAVFERPWGDKASAAREEAIEDRVEKLEQSFQAFVPPAIEDRVQKLEEQLFGHRLWNFEQQKKANMRTADISDLIDSKTTAEKLNYIVETLSRLGYDWPAILKWLNMHPEIDLAYAEAYRYTETTN